MRQPLTPLSKELSRIIRAQYGPRGVDEELLPVGSTAAEKLAAANPGVADPSWKERIMETKPGYKTTEFWVVILAKLAQVILAFLAVAGGPVQEIATSVASGGGVAGVIAPLAKEAVLGLIAWLIQRLATKYGEQRTLVKTTTLKAAEA